MDISLLKDFWPLIAMAILLILAFAVVGRRQDTDETWVTVFKTGDSGELALIKSILEKESIPFHAKGERVQDLFGIGRLGTGFNIITGPVELQVPARFQEEATQLITDLKSTLF